jgi:hypothetical protein
MYLCNLNTYIKLLVAFFSILILMHHHFSSHLIRLTTLPKPTVLHNIIITHFIYQSTSAIMAAKSPIVLILGSGPNIGQSVARRFASEGYKVAIASRSQKETDSTDKQLNIKTDLTKPLEVADAFSKVKTTFGTPGVVIYNGMCFLQTK